LGRSRSRAGSVDTDGDWANGRYSLGGQCVTEQRVASSSGAQSKVRVDVDWIAGSHNAGHLKLVCAVKLDGGVTVTVQACQVACNSYIGLCDTVQTANADWIAGCGTCWHRKANVIANLEHFIETHEENPFL